MALQVRKPTGLPSWPVIVLAGREKAGKTWTALAGSASPLVGRTLYIGVGEDDPDEYSAIPGADFDIVVHDGTYAGIRGAVEDAAAEPFVDGKPTLIVLDSATRAWNLIVDNAQAIANRKAKGLRDPLTGDFTITTDLWNSAAAQWAAIMKPLLEHNGPVVITARLDNVMVMRNGQPTQEKEWKIQGHKTLPFDATAVVEMRERGHFLLTGVKSARIALPEPRLVPEFSLPWFWDLLGLASGVGERTHSAIVGDSGLEDAVALLLGARDLGELQKAWQSVVKAGLGKEPELIEAKDTRKAALQTPAPETPAGPSDATESPTRPESGTAAPGEESPEEYEVRVAAEFDAIADAEAEPAGAGS